MKTDKVLEEFVSKKRAISANEIDHTLLYQIKTAEYGKADTRTLADIKIAATLHALEIDPTVRTVAEVIEPAKLVEYVDPKKKG